MISVSSLSHSFGDRTLFEDAAFQLNAGSRYGLVGANGSGKTTLLNILTGDLEPTEGTVSIPSRLRLGVLRQDQFLYEEQPILSVAMMGNRELWDARDGKEKLLARGEADFDADLFAELEDTFQRHDGYVAEARAGEILEGLGIPTHSHHEPLSTLSGGFKLRVLLAQALAGAPDALLLDEPTNHLDILSIRWLEKFLREFAGPVVVISHDHRFLDNVATHILDVDYQTVLLYPGTYDDFQRAKAEERERRQKEISSREREIAHHQKFVDRFRAKASKARQAQSKLRLIEKKADSLVELPRSSRRYPTFRFDPRRASGREVLTLKGIRKAFGDNAVLHGVDLAVRRGDRMAIMGPNGIGKSTLLKIAVGALEPDDGEVEWGYETHVGYFAQDHHEEFENGETSAEAWVSSWCDGQSTSFIRGKMGMVLFSGDDAQKRLGALSGGEAARLVFCRLSLERPNVLVLDEPTNHLDLESIEALVDGLLGYEGTLILVSHDRWFVSRLANRVVEITQDGIRDYRGTYEEYVHHCGDDHLDVDRVVLQARTEKRERKEAKGDTPLRTRSRINPQRRRKLSAERDRLTERIDALESDIRAVEAALADPALYDGSRAEEIEELGRTREALQAEVAERMQEWEALETKLEGSA